MIWSKIIYRIFVLFLVVCSVGNVSAGTIPCDTSYTTYHTWIKLKKHYPQITINKSFNNSGLTEFSNLVYSTINEDRKLHMDVYRPKNNEKYPAIVMIHGGGWRSGNRLMEKPMAQQLAKHGYVTIPVEYRLSLEAKYPAAVYDIKAAIRWVKTNADKLGVDTTKIVIEGESSGGHLAMLVAMTNFDKKFEGNRNGANCYANVEAAIDVDGVLDFMAPNSLNSPRNPNSPDVFWLGGTFDEKPEIWKEASPIFHVNKNSVPILFICSTQPRFHAGRDEMIDMLNQQGIYHESYTIPDTPHSFWLFQPWVEPTEKYMLSYLKKVFK